jgi:hypothetical protein
MDDTPIFASVERDLQVSYDAIAEPPSQDIGASVVAEVTPSGTEHGSVTAPRLERFDRRRWRR